ncbi:MAG: exodeoxyribonuclease III [Planctomycetota bacterium]
MRITTWNVNGLRAAIRKGMADRLNVIQPDVLLLQEIRVQPEQLPAEWAAPEGWHVTWHPAEKPGYAGTAVWTRRPHTVVSRGLTDGTSADGDHEGRVLRVKVDGVQVVSVYLPSGSSSPARQEIKEAWMGEFMPWATKLKRARTPTVLGGDLNIAHTERDIFYAKSNQNQSGFLPHEREWFSELLGVGWRDVVREHAGDVDGPYSWWSNRGQARKLDRGWRIDYLLANPASAKIFRAATTHRDAGLACSDHAPVSVDLDV